MEDHFSDNLDTTRFDLTLPSHRLAKFLRVHPHKNFLPLSVSRFNSGLLLGQALYLAKLEYNIISRSPEFINLLCNAIDLEFLSVSLDDSGRPVAVLVWAWLSRETISRITDDPTTPIHRFEMNDGNILSILYYAGSPEPLAELVFSWIEDVGKQENNILLHPFLLNVSSDIAANLTKVISVMTK
jgi:hypothetical protein